MITIYTDGACSGNPGPGGWGSVIVQDNSDVPVRQMSGYQPQTTNNRMELTAVIEALRTLPTTTPPGSVTVVTDSQYVAKAFNDRWIAGWLKRNWCTSAGKPVENKDLWLQLMDLSKQFRVKYEWTKGHAGNKYNELCDSLARMAIASGNNTDLQQENSFDKPFDIYDLW